MANYSNLKSAINRNITANGQELITGPILNGVLQAMVTALGAGYQYMGTVTPDSESVGTPDYRVFYLATAPGTYSNFGGTVVTEPTIFFYDTGWNVQVLSGSFGAALRAADVINSLTSTATDKPLSANQGKVLKEEISQLDQYVLNNYFTGAGQTYVSKNLYGLVPERTYRVVLKDPNWDMTGITGSSSYRFAIANYYNNTLTGRFFIVYVGSAVAPYYDITIPANSDYINIGGRAVSNLKVEFNIYDITEIAALKTDIETPKYYNVGYPRVIKTNDAIFVGKTANARFTYIFPINDSVLFLAYSKDTTYKIVCATYTTYAAALNNDSSGRTYIGGSYAEPYGGSGGSSVAPFKVSGSSQINGFIAVHIYRADSANLSDSDLTAIQSAMNIEITPQSSIDAIAENSKNSRLLSGLFENLSDLHPFISNASGGVGSSPTRIKFFDFDFKGGKKVSVDISAALTSIPTLVYSFGIWSTVLGAQSSAGATMIESGTNSWINTASQDVVLYASGIFSLYFKKSNEANFTPAEFETIRNNVVLSIKNIENTQDVSSQQLRELPIGTFTRESGTGSSLSPSTTIVSSSEMCVPHLGVSYVIKLPTTMNVRFVYGTGSSLGSTTSWFVDGDTVSLPSTALIQRVQFKKVDDSTLTLEEMATFISSKLIQINYISEDLPINERNYESEKYVKAAVYRLGFADLEDAIAHAGLNNMPMLIHISDLHGDVVRARNAAEYADLIKVDAIVATGDSVVSTSYNGSTFLLDAAKDSGIPLLNTIGNHEVSPKETYDNSDIFGWHISPFISQGGYLESSGTPTTSNYYYVDFDVKKLRVIVLNQYDDGCYIGEGLGGRLGQTQITWFLNTLLSTPAGYGVIIAMHSPEDKIDTPETLSKWNQTVNWDGRDEDQYGYCINGIYANAMRPIKTIIDAFIQKTAISTSYEENTVNGNTGGTVIISADFSTLAEGVEFICYLTGHRHKDNVGYYHSATEKQLCINIVTSNCHYPRVSGLSFAEGTDLPRGDKGVTQDAFNVIAIDRQNGRVKIARVGSSVNFEGIERKFLLAPYKD